jgi:hypothetical protein
MESDVDMNSFLMSVLPNAIAANATNMFSSSVGLTGLSSIAGGFHDAVLETAVAVTQSPADALFGEDGSMQFFNNATTQVSYIMNTG